MQLTGSQIGTGQLMLAGALPTATHPLFVSPHSELDVSLVFSHVLAHTLADQTTLKCGPPNKFSESHIPTLVGSGWEAKSRIHYTSQIHNM